MEKVLFICTHNSARSQMAEGLVNHLLAGRYIAYSAGTEPTDVNSYAVQVMAEIGIDISSHRSKSIDEFREERFDYVITVCDHAKEVCPYFPGGEQIHKGFEDPSVSQGTDEEILSHFRKARDEIREWVIDPSGF